jgi:hypothetical protein
VLKNVTSLQDNWLYADFPQQQGLSEIKAVLPSPLINAGLGVGVEEATLFLHNAHAGCISPLEPPVAVCIDPYPDGKFKHLASFI